MGEFVAEVPLDAGAAGEKVWPEAVCAGFLVVGVEVIGFEIQGTTFLPVDLAWVQASSRGLLVDDEDRVILRALDAARSPVIGYMQFDIPLSAIQRLDREVNFDHDLDIQVAAHILGYATPRLTPVRPGSPVLLFAGAAE